MKINKNKNKTLINYCKENETLQIEFVQNPNLRKHFQLHRHELAKRNSPNTKNERDLFHATDKSTMDKIVKNGFNRSYAGSATGRCSGHPGRVSRNNSGLQLNHLFI